MKKGKKEEKPVATDVFDPILVESRQAFTVVLMLKSPETDIQARACEAIYKFVNKSDENKRSVLDLNPIDDILELIKTDVRKLLRKRKDAVPSLVALLNPEEETIVLEFASLALGYMSCEYVSKAEIFRNQGLEPLIRCLSNSDPDVQKNSLETITQLLLNHQCQICMKDLNSFPPILELIKSEYPVIQRLALLGLERSSHDVGNRAALRELDILNILVDIVGHHEWPDLHVMAVMVLSNMLEDMESVEKFKEGSGLKKLIALVTDQTPPEEEVQRKGEKKAKSGKKGKEGRSSRQSRTGRASAHRFLSSRMGFGDAMAEQDFIEEEDEFPNDPVAKAPKEEDAPVTPTDAIFPTLPDVKLCAANAIGRAARNKESRKMLHEQETEKMLIILLSNDNPAVQAAAARSLAVMCENVSSRVSVLEWEGFPALIRLLHSDNGETLEAATLALQYLTTSNSANCLEVLKLHGIAPLIHVLNDTNDGAVSNAAAVLTNLAQNEVIRKEVWQKGVIKALVKALKSTTNETIQSNIALALANYVCNPSSREMLRQVDGIEPLVQLLKSGTSEVVRNASWAIFVCAADEATAEKICIYGGLKILQEIHSSLTRRNQFTDAALERLLDNNLSAKFSLTGYLGPTNIIQDGFFDAGPLKPNSEFKSLEYFCSQKLKDRKPIIMVNAKLSTPPKITEEYEPKQEDSRASSRNAKTKINRGRQKDRPEKARGGEEEEIQNQTHSEQMDGEEGENEKEEKPFLPPDDSNLFEYIKEVQLCIHCSLSVRDQVSALASFVSNKMGGEVEESQVNNFCWELPLSQLQYELGSNVVPIGAIKTGIHCHRALLFKVLADRCLIRCSLVRGEYNKAWNVVLLGDENSTNENSENHAGHILLKKQTVHFPPKAYIVDLIYEPGRLMKADSPEAMAYCRL
ncbi:Armadillo repeat-containing protein 3 [Acanthosepion pharaonis]|uniref:Armadillo repeat-containing protein 3 n=1 Tax=Acanthosepion pharaonis TaxID=158019 RepID=A0A812ARS5_ACAPH|nr:Armadillo repeat-containing protein 3 [Sepia pharaonis]